MPIAVVHASREKVTLDSTSLSQSSLKSNFFDEEDAVLEVDGADDSESSHDDNLQDGEGSSDSDQEADEEALQTIMRKLPSLQKKIGHEDIESDDGDGQCLRFSNLLDDSVVDDKAWGPKKSLYYNADADLDEDADAEEEQEALRIQADRMQEMNAADFMDDFDDSFAAQLENGNTENHSPSPDDNAIEFLHNGTSTRFLFTATLQLILSLQPPRLRIGKNGQGSIDDDSKVGITRNHRSSLRLHPSHQGSERDAAAAS